MRGEDYAGDDCVCIGAAVPGGDYTRRSRGGKCAGRARRGARGPLCRRGCAGARGAGCGSARERGSMLPCTYAGAAMSMRAGAASVRMRNNKLIGVDGYDEWMGRLRSCFAQAASSKPCDDWGGWVDCGQLRQMYGVSAGGQVERGGRHVPERLRLLCHGAVAHRRPVSLRPPAPACTRGPCQKHRNSGWSRDLAAH